MVNFNPLYENILIKKIEDDVKIGSVYVTGNDTSLPNTGEVIAIGCGKLLDNGEYSKLLCKVGDRVLYNKFVGSMVKIDGTDYIVVKENEILGILSNGENNE